MRNRIIALAVLLLPVVCAADDFMALPGLWKTSSQSEAEPQVLWHCVDEDADPWAAFAQFPDEAGMSCARPTQERTSTSLTWKIECKGAEAVTSEGSIVFDSPLHYTGSVRLTRTIVSGPVQSITQIEGKRYAACTSPRD